MITLNLSGLYYSKAMVGWHAKRTIQNIIQTTIYYVTDKIKLNDSLRYKNGSEINYPKSDNTSRWRLRQISMVVWHRNE